MICSGVGTNFGLGGGGQGALEGTEQNNIPGNLFGSKVDMYIATMQ